MKKPDIKQLLIDKGEKIGLGIAGGLMLLFMVVGIIALADIPESGAEQFPKKIGDKTNQIKGYINGPAGDIKDTVTLKKDSLYPFEEVPRDLAAPRLVFDPVAPPDDRRTNPTVLGMSEIYAVPVLAKIPAVDIVEIDGKPHVGVLEDKDAKNDDNQKAEVKKALAELGGKFKPRRPRPAPMAKNGPPMGFMGQPPMGFMGQPPMGIAGQPPMGIMGRPMGMTGNAMRPPGLGMTGGRPMMPPAGMNGGKPGAVEEPGTRTEVMYVEIDDKKLEGKRFALTVYPKRLVVLQASFPYKAQLEEIQKALRLDSLKDISNTPDATPVFHGVVVQRRVFGRDGKPSDWEEFDYRESYRAIHSRRLSVNDEDPKLAHVLLHSEHELVVPLPNLMKGGYPDPTTPLDPTDAKSFLPSIAAAVNAFASKKAVPPPPPPSRLKGEDSIFGGGKTSDALYRGQPKVGPDAGADGLRFPMMKKMDGPAGTPSESKEAYQPPDFVLVRIIDADVEPDVTYEYRMQIRMQNPNWVGPTKNEKVEKPQKYELMSRPTDADIEILPQENLDPDQVAGKRSVMTPAARRWDNDAIWNRAPVARVMFPPESFFYATEPPPVDPKEKKNLHELKPGQGVLQFQRWMPFVKIGTSDEPVGDWVVADVVVTRGQLVGGKQFVSLPLWSSQYNRYMLRETAELKLKSKEPAKRGVMMDPTSTLPTMLAVEVEGGKQSPRIGGRYREDDSASEILLMAEDGQLQVRDSFVERQNPKRKERESTWNDWISKIDEATEKLKPKSKEPKGPIKGKFD